MDVFQEAVDYLEARGVPLEAEADVLEEDVFHEEVAPMHSPLLTNLDLPDTPTLCSENEMLEKRLVVMKGILESEEVYLNELETLLMPMKALRASAGTSQPVLSTQQLDIVFYQVPELRDVHQSFYSGLKARVTAHFGLIQEQEPAPGTNYSSVVGETKHKGFELTVGDLFLKLVNQIGVYGGYIENYVEAVNVVRKCTQADPRFRTLAESMMSNNNGSPNSRTKYTFEALLYKPLDRVTKTTLVLRDLLKTTPQEHQDYAPLREALRLSRSFLSGVNESSQGKRGVTLTHEKRRQLIRDGFVVDENEGEHFLRHLFLYTDLLLCTRVKPATRGKQDQYRFGWYLPLAGLKLRCFSHERTPEMQLRLHAMRNKMYLLQKQPQHYAKVTRARSLKKQEQMESLLLTLAPVFKLELQSPNGKSHTFLSSLYELEEWREAISKLTKENIETVPPDLLTLTSSCVKLRMTQHPPLHSSSSEKTEGLRGTLAVVVHSASGLQQPTCVFVCVEVDGCDFYEKQAQTHSIHALNPQWEQELYFQVDGARHMRVICVGQLDSQDTTVLGKTCITLDPKSLSNRWRKQSLNLGQIDVHLSLKYTCHPPDPPSPSSHQQQPVFGVSIQTVAQQEGVLVPHVVRCCIEEIERRGMDEVGIYRISGIAGDINTLKAAFNSNLCEAVTRLRSTEVNAVSGVLKLYFRELPDPLIPAELFQRSAHALDLNDTLARTASLLSVLQSCPDTNRNTLLFLLHHLQRVSERQDVNKMSLLNLATVFGPSLLRPPVAGGGSDGPGVDISQEVVVQVQVVLCYLQCSTLPEPCISLPHDTDAEDETTHL